MAGPRDGGGKKKVGLRASGRGRERRDLESRVGDELRKDPVEHIYVTEVPGG